MSASQSTAVADWFAAHDAYHKASDAYNARLALVRAARETDDWSLDLHYEYRRLNEAQQAALRADESLYQVLAQSASVK